MLYMLPSMLPLCHLACLLGLSEKKNLSSRVSLIEDVPMLLA